MNDLYKDSIVKNYIKDDINAFTDIMKANIINGHIADLLHLMELNDAPLTKRCLDAVKSKKLLLVYSEDLKNTSIRYYTDKNVVYINASKYGKQKRESAGIMKYVIPQDQLYSLLLGGYLLLEHDTLAYNRDYLTDVANLYMELLPKIFTKGGNFFSDTDKVSKFHFILLFNLFSKNKTIISNPRGFCTRITEIKEEDVNYIHTLYNLEKIENYNFEELLTNVIQKEFKFTEKLNMSTLIYNATLVYGAENLTLIDRIEALGLIMIDCVIGNRPALNVTNSVYKNLVKSSMYNNILIVLGNK
jgi:hypothetical protein|nr:MAG TPA: hypothetical protein [Caudoviricetes sp.]